MDRRFAKATYLLPALVIALLVFGLVRPDWAGSLEGGAAKDIAGGFVKFAGGVLTVNVPHGKLKGHHHFTVPDGIPVLVYSSPGHPNLTHSPDGLQNVAPDTRVEVTVDSRDFVIRITVGDGKSKKKTGSS